MADNRLPAPWSEHISGGKKFYYNSETNTTHWTLPKGIASNPHPAHLMAALAAPKKKVFELEKTVLAHPAQVFAGHSKTRAWLPLGNSQLCQCTCILAVERGHVTVFSIVCLHNSVKIVESPVTHETNFMLNDTFVQWCEKQEILFGVRFGNVQEATHFLKMIELFKELSMAPPMTLDSAMSQVKLINRLEKPAPYASSSATPTQKPGLVRSPTSEHKLKEVVSSDDSSPKRRSSLSGVSGASALPSTLRKHRATGVEAGQLAHSALTAELEERSRLNHHHSGLSDVNHQVVNASSSTSFGKAQFVLCVNLPNHQSVMMKVPSSMSLGEVLVYICGKRNLDPTKYTMQNASAPGTKLNPLTSIGDANIREVRIVEIQGLSKTAVEAGVSMASTVAAGGIVTATPLKKTSSSSSSYESMSDAAMVTEIKRMLSSGDVSPAWQNLFKIANINTESLNDEAEIAFIVDFVRRQSTSIDKFHTTSNSPQTGSNNRRSMAFDDLYSIPNSGDVKASRRISRVSQAYHDDSRMRVSVTYLGSVEVAIVEPVLRGYAEIAAQGMSRIKRRGGRNKPMTLHLSVDGLLITDQQSSDPIARFALNNILFASRVRDDPYLQDFVNLVLFIARDEELKKTICLCMSSLQSREIIQCFTALVGEENGPRDSPLRSNTPLSVSRKQSMSNTPDTHTKPKPKKAVLPPPDVFASDAPGSVATAPLPPLPPPPPPTSLSAAPEPPPSIPAAPVSSQAPSLAAAPLPPLAAAPVLPFMVVPTNVTLKKTVPNVPETAAQQEEEKAKWLTSIRLRPATVESNNTVIATAEEHDWQKEVQLKSVGEPTSIKETIEDDWRSEVKLKPVTKLEQPITQTEEAQWQQELLRRRSLKQSIQDVPDLDEFAVPDLSELPIPSLDELSLMDIPLPSLDMLQTLEESMDTLPPPLLEEETDEEDDDVDDVESDADVIDLPPILEEIPDGEELSDTDALHADIDREGSSLEDLPSPGSPPPPPPPASLSIPLASLKTKSFEDFASASFAEAADLFSSPSSQPASPPVLSPKKPPVATKPNVKVQRPTSKLDRFTNSRPSSFVDSNALPPPAPEQMISLSDLPLPILDDVPPPETMTDFGDIPLPSDDDFARFQSVSVDDLTAAGFNFPPPVPRSPDVYPPPPPHMVSDGPPPPPPPIMSAELLPHGMLSPPNRSNLLDSIRGPVALKKVDRSRPSSTVIPPSSDNSMIDIAYALSRALAERRQRITMAHEHATHLNDSVVDNGSEDDEEWE